jgi:peroxiredoxin
MLQEGDRMADFQLPSTVGGDIRLSESLQRGPAVVLLMRGHWCSYCAEQLQTFSHLSYDLWRHLDVDVLPVVGDPLPDLVEMRDRFDLRIQLLADPDLTVAREYTGTEVNDKRGHIAVAGTFVVDTDETIRYSHVADHPADRTYANYVRHFLRGGFERPYTDD